MRVPQGLLVLLGKGPRGTPDLPDLLVIKVKHNYNPHESSC